MKNKPKSFYLLCIFFIAVAITIPLQLLYIFEYKVTEISKVFNKITYLNYGIIAICCINAYLAFKTNKLLKYSLLASLLIVGVNNFYVSSYGTDFSFLQTSIATLGFALFPVFLLMPKGFFVLNHPEKCFWIPAKRLKTDGPILMKGRLGVYLRGKGLNISKSGMLVELKNTDKGTLKLGEKVSIELLLPKGDNLQCSAKVVRKGNELENQELALEFDDINLKRDFMLFTKQYAPSFASF